jgi:hypothetical protein
MGALGLLALAVLLATAAEAEAGVTSWYRRKLEATADMPLDADVFRVPPGYNAPQQVRGSPASAIPSSVAGSLISSSSFDETNQVHITLGDQTGTAMTVSWVTASELGNGTVTYGRSPEKMEMSAEGTHTRYDYFNYTSGFIHHCTLKNLKVINEQ